MRFVDYIDPQKLARNVSRGYVRIQHHNTLPLSIYTYSRKAVFDNEWNEVTTKTRGLVVHGPTNEIIGRPFEKFFGYNTPGISETYPRSVENVEKLVGPPLLLEKVNGHLGTLWRYDNHWGIATKGSFHSPHAEWANNWFANHFDGNIGIFPTGFTPVFEIICQDIQAHPIRYECDELVLLALVKNETGEEINYDTLNEIAKKNKLRVANRFGFSLQRALELDTTVMEGFVASYPIAGKPPLKLKIKFPSYLEQRKKFYAALKDKQFAEQRAKNGPAYQLIFERVSSIMMEAYTHCTIKKEFIEYFSTEEKKPYFDILVSLLDYPDSGKYKELIWRKIERDNKK